MIKLSPTFRTPTKSFATRNIFLLIVGTLFHVCFAQEPADDAPFVSPNANTDVPPILRVPWGAAASNPRNLDEPSIPAATERIQWRAWNSETFAEAARTGRAIVLFVTAPWCHAGRVMERSALTDVEVVHRLNEEFIPIRLNRDERPDIDVRLQQAVSTLSGAHGWPLTIFMTSEGRIFHGTTSYSREDDLALGRAGLRTALRKVEQVWREGRTTTLKESAEFERQFQTTFVQEKTAGDIPTDCLNALAMKMQSDLDEKAGGPTGSKFPTPRALDACLDHYRRSNDVKSLHVCTSTLTAMLQGGMFDHLAGGFHRCCLDRWWRIPRFEKLLTFNAEMLSVCLHAWQTAKSERYKNAIETTIAYWETMIDRDTGLFYNSQPADVNGMDDGDYFTWSSGEIESALQDDIDCRLACAFYGITETGNMSSAGACRNALFEVMSIADAAQQLGLDEPEARQRLKKIDALLLEAREQRMAPAIDRGLYTDGNALMAGALMECGKEFARPDWMKCGETALKTLLRGTGANVRHIFGHDAYVALAQDEAAVFHACTIGYEVAGDAAFLKEAEASFTRLQKNFCDEKSGSFIDRTEGSRPEPETCLNWRVKPYVDTSEPSTAGLIAKACLRMYALTGRNEYRNQTNAIVEAYGVAIVKSGPYAATLCSAADALIRSQGVTPDVKHP